jgi:hypothetical protein
MAATPALADLARDAGTVRIMGEEGNWVMENAAQLEEDGDGKIWTVELGLQYAPVDRVQLLLEPVLWEWDQPKDGENVDGVGDTDFTVAYQVIEDEDAWPALVFAGKVKIPTADNREIGTGKADYSAIVILGKEFGELDLNLELEYATYGDDTDDQCLYSFSADYGLTENFSVYAEVFGETAPSDDEGGSNAAGVGIEYDVAVSEYANPFITLGIDTDGLKSVRAGMEWTW